MGDEREGAWIDSVVGPMREAQNLKEEPVKRVREYCVKSGVDKIIDGMNRERDFRERINWTSVPEEGKVIYEIDLIDRSLNDRARVDIEVNLKGTIKIVGGWFGSSTIKEDKWAKDPELINKALAKAFRHPIELGPDLQGGI
jgi:hypothetical protein